MSGKKFFYWIGWLDCLNGKEITIRVKNKKWVSDNYMSGYFNCLHKDIKKIILS